jgi:tRNA(Leu) C34 or U34 (ribose-2'-O)-methylase TrmL
MVACVNWPAGQNRSGCCPPLVRRYQRTGVALGHRLRAGHATLRGDGTRLRQRGARPVQDPGNVGSVLRSAAAFGCTQVLALKGTAALWSPKVLRAGMGAHFGLRLLEGLDEADLAALAVPLLATDPHAGPALHELRLPRPCAWVLGHEGQGVSTSLLAACRLHVRIPQPGGEESLNVAAAAAVCSTRPAGRHCLVGCKRPSLRQPVSRSAGPAAGRAGWWWRSPRSTCASTTARRCLRAHHRLGLVDFVAAVLERRVLAARPALVADLRQPVGVDGQAEALALVAAPATTAACRARSPRGSAGSWRP